jgi:hypothetical protein
MRFGAINLVSAHLAAGRRSLHGLAEPGAPVDVVDASELPDAVWLNVNTPADWERFVRGSPG